MLFLRFRFHALDQQLHHITSLHFNLSLWLPAMDLLSNLLSVCLSAIFCLLSCYPHIDSSIAFRSTTVQGWCFQGKGVCLSTPNLAHANPCLVLVFLLSLSFLWPCRATRKLRKLQSRALLHGISKDDFKATVQTCSQFVNAKSEHKLQVQQRICAVGKKRKGRNSAGKSPPELNLPQRIMKQQTGQV